MASLPPSLHTLRLAHCGFFGVIPAAYGAQRWRALALEGNRLRGRVPPALDALPTLSLFPGNRGLEHAANPDFDAAQRIDYDRVQAPSTCRDAPMPNPFL